MVTGKVRGTGHQRHNLDIELKVPGNESNITIGFDGGKVLIAVRQQNGKLDVLHIPLLEEEE